MKKFAIAYSHWDEAITMSIVEAEDSCKALLDFAACTLELDYTDAKILEYSEKELIESIWSDTEVDVAIIEVK